MDKVGEMPKQAQQSKPACPTWAAESYRLTAFPSNGADPESASWSAIVGDAPSKQVIEPRKGERLEEGALGDGLLRLLIRPGRIDWIYSSIQRVETATADS